MKYLLYGIGGIVIILIIAALLFYFWPTTSKQLQTSTSASSTYDQAVKLVEALVASQKAASVTSGCTSQLMTHSEKTAKTVVLFHGITACPDQFKAFGQQLFNAGYNVYIPLAPYHGTSDPQAHKDVRSIDLVNYANQSVTIATGLGSEVGVIGLSGGAVVATWAAEYRPEVTRLLALSPFYEPAAAQAPKWQLPILKKLYGPHILANSSTEPDGKGFSLWALANYLLLADNFKKTPADLNLKSIGIVESASDDVIDRDKAVQVPQTVADSNSLPLYSKTIPAEWNVGHAIVSPDEKGVAEHQQQLFDLYQAYYEGRQYNL
ncbi:alpha/beta fold hydrolase [bacterium]|nr:MAG: alpha/beta fold hydrolase [bacterium]